jgi:4'-phosphopantetheinyl transferase
MAPVTVDLRWHPVDVGGDVALSRHIGAVLGDGEISTGRLCPRCGSPDHGRPWARHDGHEVHVSLSRAGPHLLTAVSLASAGAGAIGVDVESVADLDAKWDGDLVLAPGEVADESLARARTWVSKEAILKVYGVGLAQPMTELSLAAFDGELVDVPAPDGFVAALASV